MNESIERLNANFDQRVVIRTTELDWQPSPSPTVLRKRLELSGPVESPAGCTIYVKHRHLLDRP